MVSSFSTFTLLYLVKAEFNSWIFLTLYVCVKLIRACIQFMSMSDLFISIYLLNLSKKSMRATRLKGSLRFERKTFFFR